MYSRYIMLATLLTISLTPSNRIIAESENDQTNCEQQSQDQTSCTDDDVAANNSLVERLNQVWQKFVDPKNCRHCCKENGDFDNEFFTWYGLTCQGCNKSFDYSREGKYRYRNSAKRACWRHARECKGCCDRMESNN